MSGSSRLSLKAEPPLVYLQKRPPALMMGGVGAGGWGTRLPVPASVPFEDGWREDN